MSPAAAGNPLGVAHEGQPIRWAPGAPIEYRLDQGGLGALSHEEAADLVRSAFAEWTNASGVNLGFTEGAVLDTDVTTATLTQFRPGAINGYNVVVFDADGSFFEALGTQAIGLGGIEDFDPETGFATEGNIFLNGIWIDGIQDASANNPEIPLETFRAALVHEIGHLIGLGHADLNGFYAFAEDPVPGVGLVPSQDTDVETMFSLVTAGGASLHLDDLSTARALYPAEGGPKASLAGEVRDADGEPVAGVLLVAREASDPLNTAVATLSGALTQKPLSAAIRGEWATEGLPEGEWTLEATEAALGTFAQAVRSTYLNAIGSPTLGLFYGPPEGWSAVETELDDPAGREPFALAAGAQLQRDIVLNNIERVLDVPAAPQFTASGNHSIATATVLTYPAYVTATAERAVTGELVVGAGTTVQDDIEDYYRIDLPVVDLDASRWFALVEPIEGGYLADLDMYVLTVSGTQLLTASATAGPAEHVALWQARGPVIIAVSTRDLGAVEASTLYRLIVARTDLPRSGLTSDTLRRVLAGERFLDPSEATAADRRADGTIDAADLVLQVQSPAPVQPAP